MDLGYHPLDGLKPHCPITAPCPINFKDGVEKNDESLNEKLVCQPFAWDESWLKRVVKVN